LNSEQTRLPHVIFDEAEEEEMGRTDVTTRKAVVATTTHDVWELWQRSLGSAQERMTGLLERPAEEVVLCLVDEGLDSGASPEGQRSDLRTKLKHVIPMSSSCDRNEHPRGSSSFPSCINPLTCCATDVVLFLSPIRYMFRSPARDQIPRRRWISGPELRKRVD
jgi:hypothetical protein